MTHRGASYPPPAPSSSSSSSILALEASGANPELLRSMMDCVDTSLFSPAQLANWSHMKTQLAANAPDAPGPLTSNENELVVIKTEMPLDRSQGLHYNTGSGLRSTTTSSSSSNSTTAATAMEEENPVDFRPLLHREASIQDVLACLLDQQPPSGRRLNAGNSFLETASTSSKSSTTNTSITCGENVDPKPPSLQKLLSASAFSLTEKKESMRQLLSFIDSSFASNTPEPLTQVYKDCEAGTLQRLSSLQLMRSFMTPAPSSYTGGASAQSSRSGGGMGTRTTSFEIIQAMLNATSNQAIQKPMTSQDSFRFQHLARTLESIETDVSVIDNEDYGGDDVVQVDNLDNLLDYHGANGSNGAPTSSAANAGFAGGTQPQVNPSRTIYSEMNSKASSNGSTFLTFGQSLSHQQHTGYNAGTSSSSGGLPTIDMMNQQQQNLPYQQQQHQLLLQQQLLRQEQEQKQQHQYNRLYHNSLLQQQQRSGVMMSAPGYGGTNQPMPQFPNMLMQPGGDMLSHKQQVMRSGHPQQQMRISTQGGRPIRTDANGIPLCSALGCNHTARIKGMCKLHGGGRRCKVDGCMKSAQTGHLCIAHGGGKPCSVEGCPKTAQSRGLCKQHGGGVRCKFEGCTKSCQSGGFCRGHGGGKRCEYPSCTKWAQKNGHCAKHAQEIAAQHLQQQQALQTQMQQQQLVRP
uniref:WRKY19-like zinc finger domain-containing protein n=1 Tax=Hyaloperonospora arabidopsidis (strain Emoy2) TaxID=559515 RepID=M4BCD9_HYAAE